MGLDPIPCVPPLADPRLVSWTDGRKVRAEVDFVTRENRVTQVLSLTLVFFVLLLLVVPILWVAS